MQEITLEQLLEAGAHFGHKSERWHPKASEFIWQEKDGIHIIDLAKTKAGLDSAMAFLNELGRNGGTVLFVGSKRQARGVVQEAAKNAGANYLVQRWIGGFLTNWEGVHKNIKKIVGMMTDREAGGWKRFPKHEQTKMARYLKRLNVDYEGVLTLDNLPKALVVVDVRKEQTSVKEAQRMGIPVVGVVDTNANPEGINYVIPSNDDAVGAVQFVITALATAFREGKEKFQKEADRAMKEVPAVKTNQTDEKPRPVESEKQPEPKLKVEEKQEVKEEKKADAPKTEEAPKKKSRAKKAAAA